MQISTYQQILRQMPDFILPTLSQHQSFHLALILNKGGKINIPNSNDQVFAVKAAVYAPHTQFKEFSSHSQPCIILKSENKLRQKNHQLSKGNQSDQQTKFSSKKPSQKQTRNVGSNLLRIFLKNILQIKFYDQIVELILIRNGNNHTCQQFYQWLLQFNINFKNYIKIGEIKRVLGKKEPQVFKKIFITLLKNYAEDAGVSHCLTSKRIDKNSIKMHIKGLHELTRDILSIYFHQQS